MEMEGTRDIKEIPHLIIKKVARSSQKHMEEFVRQFGNVDSVYYSKNDNEHPHMFVVYTKESSLNRAYVAINERFPLFEVTLKAIIPKTPTYCIECMKKSFYFCESCSAPYCSEACQKKNWPEHAIKCVSIPKLVQMQWRDNEQKHQLSVSISDKIVIVGYQLTGYVTVRLSGSDDIDSQYLRFLDDCNEEAERSPVVGALTEDSKVWARLDGQWYRAKVESANSQRITVQFVDLAMTEEVAKDDLRQLKSKDLFFRPTCTRSYRLKSLRQMDIFSSPAVRNRMQQAMKRKELFTVTDNTNNYIDLQLDGQPKSFNYSLVNLYERQTGIQEETEAPPPTEIRTTTSNDQQVTIPLFTMDKISYPAYEAEMNKPPLYIFDTHYDGLTWIIHAFHMKYGTQLKLLLQQLKKVGKEVFQNQKAPASFDTMDVGQLFLLKNDGVDDFDRCVYESGQCFQSIDVGKKYESVALDKVRYLPRELIAQSYLLNLLLDDDSVEDMVAMEEKLQGLKNCLEQSIDQLVHMGDNSFKCVWKKV